MTVPSDVTFLDVPAPDVDDAPPAADIIACTICGTDITGMYSGQGRKPKYCDEHKPQRSGERQRSSNASIEAALAAMSTAYDLMQLPLMMLSPLAVYDWNERKAALLEQDRAIFAADPALARSITKGAAKGAKATFIALHAAALGATVRVGLADRREKKAAAQPEPDPSLNGHAPEPTTPTGWAGPLA